MFEKQEQSASDGGIATQAGRDIVINMGISYTEARNIAEDVFKNNFYKLSEVAANEVDRRINYITDKIIKEFQESNPEGINKFKDPGFQVSLYEVQKSYAKTGDMNLADMLINMLIERSKHDERSYLQIVMDEAIAVVPKLTKDHLNIMTNIFTLWTLRSDYIYTCEDLVQFIKRMVEPFLFENRHSYFSYLVYLGCITNNFFSEDIKNIFFKKYQGLFQICSDIKDINMFIDSDLFISCGNNKYKIDAINHKILESKMCKSNIGEKDKKFLHDLFDKNFMDIKDIKNICMSLDPSIEKIYYLWEKTQICSFSLSPVGSAIAFTNFKKHIGEWQEDISKAIN